MMHTHKNDIELLTDDINKIWNIAFVTQINYTNTKNWRLDYIYFLFAHSLSRAGNFPCSPTIFLELLILVM